jgi:hypothetical protein
VAAAIVALLVHARGTESAREWLTRFALLATAPDLAAAPEGFARLAQALQASILADAIDRAAPPVEEARPQADRLQPELDKSTDAVPPITKSTGQPQAIDYPAEAKEALPAHAEPIDPARVEPEASFYERRERATKAAGVFLLIRPLWRMNIEPWLSIAASAARHPQRRPHRRRTQGHHRHPGDRLSPRARARQHPGRADPHGDRQQLGDARDQAGEL